MMFMLLMGGSSLLLPMLMGGGGGGNPLAAITEKLGGLFGGGKEKDASAATQSTGRSGGSEPVVLPELPKIRARKTVAPAASSLPAHPRKLSSPDLTGATTSGDALSPSAPASSGSDVASADAARDRAYTTLQAALESGDMTRIRSADQAYRAADQGWKQARRRSVGL